MQINSEKLEQVQIVLRGEDSVIFWAKGADQKNGYWRITWKAVGEFGKEDEKGEAKYNHRHPSTFTEWVKDKDMLAETTIYRPKGGYDQEKFDDWDHLARFIGISDLVVVSTKIHKSVAKKLKYYAAKDSDVSATLRELIYKYVKESIIANAERDLFND